MMDRQATLIEDGVVATRAPICVGHACSFSLHKERCELPVRRQRSAGLTAWSENRTASNVADGGAGGVGGGLNPCQKQGI